MLGKHQHKSVYQSPKVRSKNHSPMNHKILSLSPNSSILKLNIRSNHTSKQKCEKQDKYQAIRQNKYDKSPKNQTLTSFRQKNGTFQFEVLKNRIKNVLSRMKYKDKLQHLQKLVKEGRSLSEKYGYFYVTGAMFIFKPQSQIKLSLWIHPNVQEQKVMHPIKRQTQTQKQKQFYASLKFALKQIFPTISLGEGLTFVLIIDHIHQLQQNLQMRLLKSVSPHLESMLGNPRESEVLMKHSSNKVLKISRLIDFNEGISVIEEGEDQQKSMVEGESNFWKKNDFEEKHSGFNKNKILNKERRPLSKIEDWKRETLELNLSTLLRVRKDEEDERQKTEYTEFTLQQSKLRQSLKSKQKVPNKLYQELRKILNA